MSEEASLQVDNKGERACNRDTFCLWHSICFAERYMSSQGKKSTAFVLQTAEVKSVLQSLSLNSPSKTF